MIKNHKIAVVIPYFGKLPNWFQIFLLTSKSELITFFLITDDETDYNFPDNFVVFYKKFPEIQELFKKKLNNSNLYLSHPYKLCDYKPCFGLVFSDILKGFSYWGHCDVDVVFGDIDNYLSKIDINMYDRLFSLGHFSLYKNNEIVNNAFRLKMDENAPKFFDFDFVSRTSLPCYFDEVGMNYILRYHGFNFYEKNYCANVHSDYLKFRLGDGVFKHNSILVYQNRKVFEIENINRIHKNEYMYFHLMNRGSIYFDINIKNDFLISNYGFLSFEEKDIPNYLKKYGGKETERQQKDYSKFFIRKKLKNVILKIKREVFYNKIKIVYIYFHRYKLKKWLEKNNSLMILVSFYLIFL